MDSKGYFADCCEALAGSVQAVHADGYVYGLISLRCLSVLRLCKVKCRRLYLLRRTMRRYEWIALERD